MPVVYRSSSTRSPSMTAELVLVAVVAVVAAIRAVRAARGREQFATESADRLGIRLVEAVSG